jgi:hypothetical protein
MWLFFVRFGNNYLLQKNTKNQVEPIEPYIPK